MEEYVDLKDIMEASQRINGFVIRTELHHSKTLSDVAGCSVYLKPENFQRTGAFKIRGALNKLKYLKEHGQLTNVVTASSGNHGQALSLAAKIMGVKAIVVVPEGGSAVKLAAIKEYGGEAVSIEWDHVVRREKAKQIAQEKGYALVSSHDEREIIAGQGTIGLEILEQLPDVDTIVAPIGGGGLISGVSVAVKSKLPKAKVFGAEPQLSPSMTESLKAGKRIKIPVSQSIADGLRSVIPGENTFPIVQRYVDDVVTVAEDEIRATLAFLLERCKMVVEPSGAVSLAAVLFKKLPVKNRKVAVVLSGGNINLKNLGEYAIGGYRSLL